MVSVTTQALCDACHFMRSVVMVSEWFTLLNRLCLCNFVLIFDDILIKNHPNDNCFTIRQTIALQKPINTQNIKSVILLFSIHCPYSIVYAIIKQTLIN